MQKVIHPIDKKIAFNCTDEILVNLVIKLLRDAGLEVYVDTTKFDPTYPYVVWDSEVLTQYLDLEDGNFDHVETDMGKFIKHFIKYEDDKVIIPLSSEYKATTYADKVVVGCQTIPYDKVKEVFLTMGKLRKAKYK